MSSGLPLLARCVIQGLFQDLFKQIQDLLYQVNLERLNIFLKKISSTVHMNPNNINNQRQITLEELIASG